jgi:hypothetical protein
MQTWFVWMYVVLKMPKSQPFMQTGNTHQLSKAWLEGMAVMQQLCVHVTEASILSLVIKVD